MVESVVQDNFSADAFRGMLFCTACGRGHRDGLYRMCKHIEAARRMCNLVDMGSKPIVEDVVGRMAPEGYLRPLTLTQQRWSGLPARPGTAFDAALVADSTCYMCS